MSVARRYGTSVNRIALRRQVLEDFAEVQGQGRGERYAAADGWQHLWPERPAPERMRLDKRRWRLRQKARYKAAERVAREERRAELARLGWR